MTPSASPRRVPRLGSRRAWLFVGFVAVVALLVAACLPGGTPLPSGVTPAPTPTGTPQHPLAPAPLNPDPISLLAWLWTPIFQTMFVLLVAIDQIVPDIGIAIIVLTLIIRTLFVPLTRRSMVSMRQIAAVAPEVKEIQRRYKGDPQRAQKATMDLYRERGISQAGCLIPLLSQLLILPVMYYVIQQGLQAYDPRPMLQVFGVQLINLDCPSVAPNPGVIQPCLDPTIPWLGGINASLPSVVNLPVIGFGISILAIVYVILSVIASRMALPPHDPDKPLDPQARTQRTLSLWLPLIFLLYGNIIPVGLYIYLLVATVYQVIQQYLTTGWGAMFPLFGRTPAFAVGHQPRFPVAVPAAPIPTSREAGAPARPSSPRSALERSASAQATIRQRGRQGRRGRRR